jgi:hypothetical protein
MISVGSGYALDFSSAAAAEPAAAELLEQKVCEGYNCGRTFWRPRAFVKDGIDRGLRICKTCRAKQLEQIIAARAAIEAVTANKHRRGQ